MSIQERLAAFRERMAKENMAAVVVPTADSHASEYIADHFKTRQWLCGFTGSAVRWSSGGRKRRSLRTAGTSFRRSVSSPEVA